MSESIEKQEPHLHDLSPEALASRLQTDGYAVLDALCDQALVRSMLEISRTRYRVVREALGDREIGIGSAAGFIELVQRSPGRWDVPISPEEFAVTDRDVPWWPVVAAVLGSDAEPSFSGVVRSEPGSPAQCWHIDSPHEAAEHRPAHAVNVLIALHDIPLEMGPTEYVPGSQVLTNHHRNPSLVRDQLVYQHPATQPAILVRNGQDSRPEQISRPLRAGSALVFDDRILHRGLANHTHTARHVAYFSYRKKNYASGVHFESTRSVFAPAMGVELESDLNEHAKPSRLSMERGGELSR